MTASEGCCSTSNTFITVFLVTTTHVAHVGLQLRDTLIFRCVQDNGEVGEVLLSVHWIVHL